MKKQLQKYALIAEIISAGAIIVSLVYVGIQVKDNSSAVQSSAANNAIIAMQNWYLAIGSDTTVSDEYYAALTSMDELSANKEFQLLMNTHSLFLGYQNSFLLATYDPIDSNTPNQSRTPVCVFCRCPMKSWQSVHHHRWLWIPMLGSM